MNRKILKTCMFLIVFTIGLILVIIHFEDIILWISAFLKPA